MIFAAAQAIFFMFVYVDAFYLRKPGKITYVLVFNLRVPPRVGANRRVLYNRVLLAVLISKMTQTFI